MLYNGNAKCMTEAAMGVTSFWGRGGKEHEGNTQVLMKARAHIFSCHHSGASTATWFLSMF